MQAVLTMRHERVEINATCGEASRYLVTLKTEAVEEFILYEIGSLSSVLGLTLEAVRDLEANGVETFVDDPDNCMVDFYMIPKHSSRTFGKQLLVYMDEESEVKKPAPTYKPYRSSDSPANDNISLPPPSMATSDLSFTYADRIL